MDDGRMSTEEFMRAIGPLARFAGIVVSPISCTGCAHDLGGGCCRINAEGECREGGGFELWTPKEEGKHGAD